MYFVTRSSRWPYPFYIACVLRYCISVLIPKHTEVYSDEQFTKKCKGYRLSHTRVYAIMQLLNYLLHKCRTEMWKTEQWNLTEEKEKQKDFRAFHWSKMVQEVNAVYYLYWCYCLEIQDYWSSDLVKSFITIFPYISILILPLVQREYVFIIYLPGIYSPFLTISVVCWNNTDSLTESQ
jgi:hypothetical protein